MARHLVWIRGTDGSNTVDRLEEGDTAELYENSQQDAVVEPLNIGAGLVALVSADQDGNPLYGVELLGYLS